MDQVTPTEAVKGSAAQHNGLAPQVAAVEAARAKLARDLDLLTVEARAEIGLTMEKIAWKVAAAGAGILAGLAVRQALAAGWKAARHHEPPTNPAAPGTSWGEALGWTMALAAGMGAAKLVAIRGAAAGWEKATGSPPPGLGSLT